MLYIHHTSCIFPQQALDSPAAPVDGLLKAVEPHYEGIPGNALRRMSKSVKMGVGAALPLLAYAPDGILIGTGYGGMEDSIRFLNQIIEYDEGTLAPGMFVQSTANAIASQLGLFRQNKGYNITFVNRGLAFESALLDAGMLASEHSGKNWLVGGVDEISPHNYHLEYAEGWYREGAVAGEGAAVFLLNDRREGAVAQIGKIVMLSGEGEMALRSAVAEVLDGKSPDLLLSGENGDPRTQRWYDLVESLMESDTGIARFKHLCGEYPTASAFALWLACNLPDPLPGHLLKRQPGGTSQYPPRETPRRVLIYNNYKFTQHSLILLERFL